MPTKETTEVDAAIKYQIKILIEEGVLKKSIHTKNLRKCCVVTGQFPNGKAGGYHLNFEKNQISVNCIHEKRPTFFIRVNRKYEQTTSTFRSKSFWKKKWIDL